MKKYVTASLMIAASLALVAAPAFADTPSGIVDGLIVTGQFAFNKDLSVGMTNGDVAHLQALLNEDIATQVAVAPNPGSAGSETSTFGPATLAAVKIFQAGHALPATGFVGPLTRAVLNNELFAVATLPSVRSFTADTNTPGSALLTVSYDGGTEKPTIWYAYGSTPTTMSILSSPIVSKTVAGSSQITISNLGSGDCWAQVSVKNSLGTTSSAPLHCSK